MGFVYCADAAAANEAARRIQGAYQIGDAAIDEAPKLVKEIVNE
jgi:hypothetical protein